MLGALFSIGLVTFLSGVVDSCLENADLSVYKEKVAEHGYTYEMLVVNKSVPAKVVYEVPKENWQVAELEWYHNDKLVKIDDSANNEVHYAVEATLKGTSTITLHFKSPTSRLAGLWKVVVKFPNEADYTQLCTVQSLPIISRPHGAIRGTEGSPLTVKCEVDTYPPPTAIEWHKLIFNDDGFVRLERISDVNYTEKENQASGTAEFTNSTGRSGFYLCTAKSLTSSDNWLVEVRIKNHLTILWPCIGILIEVIVLAIIILVYERAQAKRKKSEDAKR